MTDTPLRFLMIEDSEDDEMLIVRRLKQGGYDPSYERVQTAAAMKKALKEKPWDIILCDYNLPKFNAPSAIAVLKESKIDLPLIIISGTIGEETAIECMRLGARDYLMKSNLSRLCPAVARELEESEARKKQRQAEKLLKKSEDRYRLLAEHTKDYVWLMDFNLKPIYISPSVEKTLGYPFDEIKNLSLDKFFTPESFQVAMDFYAVEMDKVKESPLDYTLERSLELEFMTKDGRSVWGECVFSFIRDENRKPLCILGEGRDITERRRIEDKLRFEEQRFRALVEHTSDIIVLVNREGIISYINPAVEQILGYNPEERIGRTGFELFHPDDLQFVSESFVTLISNPNTAPVSGVLRLRHKDGHYRFIEAVGSSLVRNNIVEGVILNYRDVSERVNAEEKLHLSEQRYRTILEDIQEGYFEVDLAGNFTFFNDTLMRVSGYSRDELMGMNNRQYTDEEEVKRVYEAYHKVYLTGEPNKELVWKIKRKDGVLRYIEGTISLLKDSSGKPAGFRGIAHDITDRILMEKKLKDEEQRFRALADQSSDIIALLNREGKIIYENQAVEKILGLKREARIGATGFEYLHPDDFQLVSDTYNLLLSDPNAPAQRADIRFHHVDGSWHTFETVAANIIQDNVIEGVMINLRDITERKEAEEKLEKTLESLKKAVGTTVQVLVSVLEARDPYTSGHQSHVAKLACDIAEEMGLPPDTIEGLRMAGSIHDIGKLAVPAEILSKPTRLTDIEYSLIKEHPQSGFNMVKDVDSPWALAEILYQHHERMDGSGYPRHLKGKDILLEARILTVADVVEAMSSHRPYRPTLGIKAALEEIEKNRGTLYDPNVVDACLKLFREKDYKL